MMCNDRLSAVAAAAAADAAVVAVAAAAVVAAAAAAATVVEVATRDALYGRVSFVDAGGARAIHCRAAASPTHGVESLTHVAVSAVAPLALAAVVATAAVAYVAFLRVADSPPTLTSTHARIPGARVAHSRRQRPVAVR